MAFRFPMFVRVAALSPLAVLAAGCEKTIDARQVPAPAVEVTAPVVAAELKPEAAKPEVKVEARTEEAVEAPKPVWSAEGFATPESVLVAEDVYYVSNINGAPLDKDNNGFISKLGKDGQILELKWISGEQEGIELHAPKGMALHEGTLYVADIDLVRRFEVATGRSLGPVRVEGATFLNDVHVAGDRVYVSDSGIGSDFKPAGTPGIYVIDASAEEPQAQKLEIAEIGLPNGVFAVAKEGGDTVFFNGFDDAKAIHGLDRASGAALPKIDLPAGALDGLVGVAFEGGWTFFVSSWESGAVYHLAEPGRFKAVASGLEGPADFDVDVANKVVVVPVFMKDRVDAYAF